MGHARWIIALLVPLFVFGCKQNPTAATPEDPDDEHGHELFADLELSSDHVHTLSELGFTVTVTNDHGDAVTDLELVQVERRATGDDTWRATELELQGTQWVGTYTFSSSGEYEIRVSVMEHGATEAQVLYEMDEHLHVVRAHAEVEGYRIEFENFPGHVHEGEEAAVRFWVMEAEANEAGERPAITGLHAEIHCAEEASGFEEEHVADEHEPGVYEAHHTFTSAGSAHLAIHFEGPDGHEVEADFHIHVAGGH